MISKEEERIIRFYEGDVEGEDPFWSDRKAYLTVNSLFFDGIDNEVARTDENKKLNPAFLDDVDRLLSVCTALYGAALKNPIKEAKTLSRVERYQDYLRMKEKGATISFTSTSTADFLNDYRDKRGLALLHIEIPAGTPCIDMAAVLPYYAKAEESEILLMPFTAMVIKEKEPDENLRRITDMDGKEPLVYAEMEVTGLLKRPVEEVDEKILRKYAESGKRVYESLNRHDLPKQEDILRYSQFKKMFIRKLNNLLHERRL